MLPAKGELTTKLFPLVGKILLNHFTYRGELTTKLFPLLQTITILLPRNY